MKLERVYHRWFFFPSFGYNNNEGHQFVWIVLYLIMLKKYTALLSFGVFFALNILVLVSFDPSLVGAVDNNDPSVPTCSIQVNGIDAQDNQKIYPSRLEGTTKVYPITVCDNGAFDKQTDGQVSPNTCMQESGRGLRVSVNNNPPFGWYELPLTRSGSCYTGEIRLGAGSAGGSWALDIEMDGDAENVCAVDMPACRRVSPIFESVTADATQQCKEIEDKFKSCDFLSVSPERVNVNTPVTISGTLPDLNQGACPAGEVDFASAFVGVQKPGLSEFERVGNAALGSAFSMTYTPTLAGTYTLLFRSSNSAAPGGGVNPDGREVECKKLFKVCLPSEEECAPPPELPEDPLTVSAFDLCSQVPANSEAWKSCVDCQTQSQGVWTAVGCIPAEPSSLIKTVITIGVGIGGGVALLMTLIGGFLLTTSQGNPKQQETAKEMITSAVIGLLFVMFSVVILQFIGVTILQIPGFGTVK